MNKYHKYTDEDLEMELTATRAEIMRRRADNTHNPEGITFDVDKKTGGTQQPTARIGKIDLFF